MSARRVGASCPMLAMYPFPSATSLSGEPCPRRARASGAARQCRPHCRGSRPLLACGGRWHPRSKAKNHFRALASSSSVPELAASSMRDSTSTCACAYPAVHACGTSKSMAFGLTAHSRTVRLSMPMAYVLGSHSYCGPSVISYIHRVEPDGGARRLHWDERDAVPADRRMGGTGGWPYDSRGAR